MSEGFFSRGFRGRRQPSDTSARIPPGQYLERGFPVLSAGPTPHTPLATWDFSIVGEVDQPKRWTWDEFQALPRETVTKDIHCVTKWSKLDTHWEGVSLDTLLAQVTYEASYVIAFSERCWVVRHGWSTPMKGSLCRPNMVAQHDYWCLTSTSGRAPSGCGVCAWSSRMNRASGSRLAITIMVIHGKKNGIGATELAIR